MVFFLFLLCFQCFHALLDTKHLGRVNGKSAQPDCKTQKTRKANYPVWFIFSRFAWNLRRFLLFLERCLVSVLRVRTGLIVKLDIICDRRSEFLLGAVFCSVKFFPLHRSKERLHDRIIIWDVCAGKRLCHTEGLQIGTKGV